MAIPFTMNLEVSKITQTPHSFFDQLEKLGGLFFIIATLAGLFVSLLTWNGIENSLVSHLFKRKVKSNMHVPAG